MIPKTKVEVGFPEPVGDVLRVEDLEEGCCFLKEGQLMVKQETGYCLGLDNFVRHQVRPTEPVDETYRRIHIRVER